MIDLGSIMVLRLLRLLRVVRMLNKFPALKSITTALLHAFSAVGYVMLMICIVDYVFAVIGMIMFRKNDPVHFGHMSTALMSVWCMETLDWTNILNINMLGCDEVRAITRVSISCACEIPARVCPVRLFRRLR